MSPGALAFVIWIFPQAAIQEAGVSSMIYYPIPIHRLPVYQHLPAGNLPNTDAACGEVMSLPMWPLIDEPTQRAVVDALREAM